MNIEDQTWTSDAGPGLAGGAAELASGDVIADRYVLLEKLGEGGMGVVYSAFDPELDRQIALKFFHAAGSSGTVASLSVSKSRELLLQEAQAMAAVAHPNVVTVFDVGTFDDRVFVAMALVRGCNFAEWLKAEKRDWRSIARVLRAAAAGLAAVHAQGLVHRDFKPENVLVGDDGGVHVMDFGLARKHQPSEAELADVAIGISPEPGPEADSATSGEAEGEVDVDSTIVSRSVLTLTTRTGSTRGSMHADSLTGRVVGTPSYMSPEQHRGVEVDRRSDQYSFCVAAYQAFFGHKPFRAKTLAALSAAKALGPGDMPRDHGGLPRRIYDALVRGMAVDPEQRHASLAELQAILAYDPLDARRQALRWTLAFMGPIILAAVVGHYLWTQSRACDSGRVRAEVAAFWNANVATAVRAAFQRSERAQASSSARTLTAHLDAQAADWVDAKVTTCRGLESAEQLAQVRELDLRQQCLDDLAKTMADFVGRAVRADAQFVDDVGAALQSLASVASCEDSRRLSEMEPLPDDPQLRVEVDGLRRRLDELGFGERGLPSEAARVELPRILADVRQLGYLPLEAEVRAAMGYLQSEGGSLHHALPQMTLALELAEASGHEFVIRRLLSDFIFLQGYVLGQPEAIQGKIQHAWAHVARAADPVEARANLLFSIVPTVAIAGQHELAETLSREVVELFIQLYGYDAKLTAIAMNNYGVALATLGRRHEAVSWLKQSLASDRRQLGADHPVLRLSTCNLALEMRKSGQWREALRLAQRGVAISEGDPPRVDEDAKRCAHQLGVIHKVRGEPERALQAFQLSLDLRQRLSMPADGPPLFEWADMMEPLIELGRWAQVDELVAQIRRELERIENQGQRVGTRDFFSAARGKVALVTWTLARGEGDQTLELLDGLVDLLASTEIDGENWREKLTQQRARAHLIEGRAERALAILATPDAYTVPYDGENANAAGYYELLARVQLELGRFEPARVVLSEAIDLLAEQLGPMHARLALTYLLRGRAEIEAGELAAAREDLQRADAAFDRSRHGGREFQAALRALNQRIARAAPEAVEMPIYAPAM